jgi:hypothetical protein
LATAGEASLDVASFDALSRLEAQAGHGRKGPNTRPPTIEFRLERDLTLDQNVADTPHSVSPIGQVTH